MLAASTASWFCSQKSLQQLDKLKWTSVWWKPSLKSEFASSVAKTASDWHSVWEYVRSYNVHRFHCTVNWQGAVSLLGACLALLCSAWHRERLGLTCLDSHWISSRKKKIASIMYDSKQTLHAPLLVPWYHSALKIGQTRSCLFVVLPIAKNELGHDKKLSLPLISCYSHPLLICMIFSCFVLRERPAVRCHGRCGCELRDVRVPSSTHKQNERSLQMQSFAILPLPPLGGGGANWQSFLISLGSCGIQSTAQLPRAIKSRIAKHGLA